MNTKSILFSTEMVQAILAGRKTQTRRLVKPEPKIIHALHHDASISTDCIFEKGDGRIHCPYGKPGDILWVRETFIEQNIVTTKGFLKEYVYKADGETVPGVKWKPSIFMPKEACRLFLKIKNVRVERLQEISEDDAIAEGINNFLHDMQSPSVYENYMVTRKELDIDHWAHCADGAEDSYRTLWQKINGIDSWDQNPYVWVVEFEKVDKPEGF